MKLGLPLQLPILTIAMARAGSSFVSARFDSSSTYLRGMTVTVDSGRTIVKTESLNYFPVRKRFLY